MTALSINLPDSLTKESTRFAKELGMSRTEFIKRAIIHELADLKKKQEEAKIINSFAAMKKSKTYIKQTIQTIEEFEDILPSEQVQWWKKK
ncbi:MAG: hypothetical protein COA94_08660 [Rickettsiales bacterium]|nr:MAG: hypothetical protein COA94_08660 [Rickettsiales bacterium]